MLFFEVSAKTGENIDDLFKESAEDISKKIESDYYDTSNESCGIKIGIKKEMKLVNSMFRNGNELEMDNKQNKFYTDLVNGIVDSIDKVEVNQESVNNQTEIPSQQPSEETTDKPIDKVEDNQESVDNSTDKPDQPNDNLQENPILGVDQTTDVENTSIDSVEEQVDSITE
jgi:hypothetical protein